MYSVLFQNIVLSDLDYTFINPFICLERKFLCVCGLDLHYQLSCHVSAKQFICKYVCSLVAPADWHEILRNSDLSNPLLFEITFLIL